MIAKELIKNQISLIANDPEAPTPYEKAISLDPVHIFYQAIQREHKFLLKNHTWIFVG